MPELPDVEVFKRYLEATSLNKEITTLHLRDERLVEGVSPSTLRRRVKGRQLVATRRHGKNLFAALDGGEGALLFHFGMTGLLTYYEGDGEEDEQPEHTAARIDFADGSHLAYRSRRKLGKLAWVDEIDAYIEDNDLGPDLLDDVDLRRFRELLADRRGKIKATLMDQSLMAGLGNVYVDEILYRAGVSPEAGTDRLREKTVTDIHRAMKYVIRKAIEADVDPAKMPRTFLLPHRDEGAECPKCEGTIRKKTIAGRGTYYCPSCQRRKT